MRLASIAKPTGILLIACLAAAPLGAQERFQIAAIDNIPVVPGLKLITIRDNAAHTCYTLFTTDEVQSTPLAEDPSWTLQNAAAVRDRRLDELSAAFDSAQFSQIPGIPQENPLRYTWEADKAQQEFALTVLQHMLARLVDHLDRVLAAPRVVNAELCPSETDRVQGTTGKR